MNCWNSWLVWVERTHNQINELGTVIGIQLSHLQLLQSIAVRSGIL